jgi:ArsR family transcriptional regulator, lead/cadmium/zinc/bismuth-responsive transcriptional repressor
MQRKQLNALKKIFGESDEVVVRIFNALGDPCRLHIIKMISAKEDLCVSEIASVCNITPSAASQHLTVLERAGVVRRIRMGQKTCFEIRRDNKVVRALLKII